MNGYGMPDIKRKQRPVLPNWQPHSYSVIPLLTVKMSMSKGLFTYLLDYEKTFIAASGCFFITGVDGHNIMVDTGSTMEDFIAHGCACEKIATMPEALKEATGLSPQDIDTLIFTQLHHDHALLANLFKHAKIFVQQDEWNALHESPVCYRPVYHPEYLEGCMPTLLDGDAFDIFPGIHLMYTPGHTPGGQSVVIDTQEGRVIICGVCCCEDNFNPPKELKSIWPVLVPGLHVNNEDAYQSLLRVKNEADYIITLHDIKTYERGSCPSSRWPKNKK